MAKSGLGILCDSDTNDNVARDKDYHGITFEEMATIEVKGKSKPV